MGDADPSAAARVVFVHGIGARRDPETARKEWTEALARGAARAGHSRVADDLVAGRHIETVFAYYGDLFHEDQAQGADGGLDPEVAEDVRALMAEMATDRLAGLGPDDPEAGAWLTILADLTADGTEQGGWNVVRQVVNAAGAMLSFGPLSRPGQWAGSKLLVGQLSQVSRYLRRGEPDAGGTALDARIRARVRAAVDGRPAVVVAHSLGSVVAFEELCAQDAAVPLLTTIGSPLAMRSIVWPRIRPRPPRTPEAVGRWLNFWDRDDVIAARPRLERVFEPNTAGVRPVSARTDTDGLWVHTATKYLEQPAVAGPVAEVLAAMRAGGGPADEGAGESATGPADESGTAHRPADTADPTTADGAAWG